MDKKELLNALKEDLRAATLLRNDLDSKIKRWRAEYNGDPYGNEQKGKSQIVSRDIKKQSEWQHASIIDPFVSSSDIIKASPVTFEDGPSARQNEVLLNTQFCRQFNRYNFMTKSAKVLDMEGTVVVQCGWDYEEEEVESEIPSISVDAYGNEFISGTETITETIVKKNQPTAKVCRNEDIYIDPTCQDNMDNCQFVIYRYESDLSTLRSDGRYKNLDKIKPDRDGSDVDQDYDSQDYTDFKFEDNPRKKLVVYEYWGNYDVNDDGIAEPVVCTWINDTIIRLQSNPYPDKKPPFIVVPFNSVPFQMHGEANAELISDNQKIKTAITRGIIDNMAQSNNGQKGFKKGALDQTNRKRFLAGDNFEFNQAASDFWDGGYNQIPSSAFDMLGLMNNEIESITGVKSFSGGITGNSLGATATGARGALDATSTRRLNIVRNIAENLIKPLMRKWMSYNNEFLEEQEIVRITNEEFVEISRDDLAGRVDIDIQVSTAEDNAAKAQELSFILQTVGPNSDPAISKEIMAMILDLQKMPEQAKQIRDYQPQPDPQQQRMVELDLAMKEAQLRNELAKAQENEVDSQLKLAKVRDLDSKARLTDSKRDLEDLNFIMRDNQIDDIAQMDKEEQKHNQMMEQKAYDRETTKGLASKQAPKGNK